MLNGGQRDEQTLVNGPPVRLPVDEAASQRFVENIKNSKEWIDLNILLDLLKSLQARPLIISIPFCQDLDDAVGVGKEARGYYYERLEGVCSARGLPLVDWKDYDGDPNFLIGTTSHLTKSGWLIADRVLDDFYHDRMTAAPTTLR